MSLFNVFEIRTGTLKAQSTLHACPLPRSCYCHRSRLAMLLPLQECGKKTSQCNCEHGFHLEDPPEEAWGPQTLWTTL